MIVKQILWVFILVAATQFCAGAETETPAPDSNLSTKVDTREPSPSQFGVEIQYGMVDYFNYQMSDDIKVPNNGNSIRVAGEWTPIQSFGSLGLGFAYRYFWKLNVPMGPHPTLNNVRASLKSHTIHPFISYLADFSRTQVVVPSLRFGPSATFSNQTSKVAEKAKGSGTYYGFDLAGGLAFRLNGLDPKTASRFKDSTGVKSTYLTVEYVRSFRMAESTENLEFQAIQAGLRFEI